MRAHFQHLQQNSQSSTSNMKASSSDPARGEVAPKYGTYVDKYSNDMRRETNYRPVSGAENSRTNDEERKTQKKKYRSNDQNKDYVNSKNGYNDNCQLNWKYDDPVKTERWFHQEPRHKSFEDKSLEDDTFIKSNRKHQFESKRKCEDPVKTGRWFHKMRRQKSWEDTSLEDETYTKNNREHQFESNRFTTETGKLQDDTYQYTVQMKKDSSKGQAKQTVKQVDFSPIKQEYKTAPVIELSTSDDGNTECATQITSSDSQQYATGRDLERKTSSLGNFSYLNLGKHTRTRSAAAKPACHVQSELVAEEYSTAGKLTTAGSLYALYNDHSPNLPMGQLEHSEYQRYATLPTKKGPKAPCMEADPQWFGGRGSVRDLAKVFQHQLQEHHNYQSVVNGTVNKNHSNEVQLDEKPRSYLYPTPEKYHHLVYDQEDDSSSVYTASSLNDLVDVKQSEGSSTESDEISQWVDHELKKIKRNLSKELAVKESIQNTAVSPDLFDMMYAKQCKVSSNSDSFESSESNTTQTHHASSSNQQAAGDKERFDSIDSSYYDDEIYMNKQLENDSDDENLSASPVSLPMNTVLKETPTKRNKYKKETKEPVKTKGSPGNNKRKMSRIPTSKSSLSSKLENKDAAYANIVTIKSSLDDAGVHQVTHKMKNLKTGGTRTVFNDKVNAKKVVTTFRAAR